MRIKESSTHFRFLQVRYHGVRICIINGSLPAVLYTPHTRTRAFMSRQTKHIRRPIHASVHTCAATILCSTGTFNEKISALFNLFDMDANGHVTEPEMTILMKCVLNGFCTLTGKQPVDTQRLATITHVAFVSVDQQETRDFKIEVGELLTWASSNAEPVYLLCRYNTTDGAQIKDRLKRKNSHSTHHQHRTHGHKVRDGKDGHAHAHERQRESASAVPAGTPRAHMNQKRTSNSTRNKRSSPKSARGSNLHAGKRGQGGKGGKAGKTNRRGTVVIDYSEMNRRKMERKQQRSRQQNVATYVNAVYDEKEVRRFKDLFDEADRNGDGRVDCTHLKEVIRKAADKDIDWAKIAKYHMSNNVNKNGQGSNVKDEKEGSGGHNVHNHPTGKETTSSSSHDGESGNSRGKNKETSNTSKSDDSSDRVHRTSDGHGKVGVQRGLQITFREFLVGLYPRALKEELGTMIRLPGLPYIFAYAYIFTYMYTCT